MTRPKLLDGAFAFVLMALFVLISAALALAAIVGGAYTVVQVVGGWF